MIFLLKHVEEFCKDWKVTSFFFLYMDFLTPSCGEWDQQMLKEHSLFGVHGGVGGSVAYLKLATSVCVNSISY